MVVGAASPVWIRRGLLFLALLACCTAACRRTQPIARPTPDPPRPASVQALPATLQRGVSFVHSWEDSGEKGYGSPTSQRSLAELRALGVTWISVMPFGFLAARDADSVRLPGDSGGPGARSSFRSAGESDERVRRQIADAHALGIKVLLKPHLWIRGGAWCGELDPGTPAGWTRFFATYTRFILHYAELAQSAGADLLAVGVELCTATAQPQERWRGLIAEVRQRFTGPLVYAANWDEVPRVPFWDALDFIGVQFYAPLADSPETREEQMRLRLAGHLDQLEQVARAQRRPVLFTEVGYKAIRGTAVKPHLWPEHLPGGTASAVSPAAQEQAYRVFFTGIAPRDWVAGVYIWKWFSNPDSREEDAGGFSPRGKPAEAVLRAAYSPRGP